jgi:hypothetical protein
VLVSSEKPWLRRPDWATGRVRAEEGDSTDLVLGGLFVTLWFSGMAGMAWFLASVVGEQARGPWWILGGFTVAGLVPLSFVVDSARLRARYGRSVFEMSPVPGAPGGVLQGTAVIPGTLPEAARVLATLTCWRRSEKRSMLPHVLWEAEQMLKPQPGGEASRLPVRFEIPPGTLPSQPEKFRGGVYWQLRLEGREACKGLRATFEVPVFVDMRLPAPSAAPAPAPPPKPLGSDIVVEHPGPGLTRFRFQFGPMGFCFVVMLPLLSPLLLLTPLERVWAVLWIVGLVGFALVTNFMEPMGIDVTPETVTLERGYRGWFGGPRLRVQDARYVRLENCVNNMKQVKLDTRNESHSASRVLGVMEAEWLANELRQAIEAAGGPSQAFPNNSVNAG